MGTESDTPTIETLQNRLDTEAVTFVDTVNEQLAALIDETDQLDSAYTTAVTDSLADYDRELTQAYASHVETTLTDLRTDLEHAYETRATERLTTLENRLDSANTQFHERHDHRQQTAQYRRRRRLLLAALLVLGLAVLGLAAYILI